MRENGDKTLPGITFSGDITVHGPMFDIHDNEHVHIGQPFGEAAGHSGAQEHAQERDEEMFHFVHPELADQEAWRIHDAVKRVVRRQKAKEICQYLKDLRKERKVLLPESPGIAYKELVRMGMPTGDGFSEKYFSGCYQK